MYADCNGAWHCSFVEGAWLRIQQVRSDCEYKDISDKAAFQEQLKNKKNKEPRDVAPESFFLLQNT
jgi:hypothetical protein